MIRMKQTRLALALVGLVLAAEQRLNAGVIDTVTPGALNSYHDESLERIVFPTGTGTTGITAGTIAYGIIRLNDAQPAGASLNNTAYVVFSETVMGPVSPSDKTLKIGPTAAASPFSLQSILGISTPAGTSPLAAVYDRPQGSPFPVNLINNPPNATGATMDQYQQFIKANGTLQLVAGFKTGNPDFLTVDLGSQGFTAGTVTTTILNNPMITGEFSTFAGGLSIVVNNTGFNFTPILSLNDLKLHDLTITNGAASADAFDPNYGFNPPPRGNYAQPGPDSAGFFDNATFNFFPTIPPPPPIPEPTAMLLWGVVMSGAGVLGYSRRRKA
jgi:hypothetical protein